MVNQIKTFYLLYLLLLQRPAINYPNYNHATLPIANVDLGNAIREST